MKKALAVVALLSLTATIFAAVPAAQRISWIPTNEVEVITLISNQPNSIQVNLKRMLATGEEEVVIGGNIFPRTRVDPDLMKETCGDIAAYIVAWKSPPPGTNFYKVKVRWTSWFNPNGTPNPFGDVFGTAIDAESLPFQFPGQGGVQPKWFPPVEACFLSNNWTQGQVVIPAVTNAPVRWVEYLIHVPGVPDNPLLTRDGWGSTTNSFLRLAPNAITDGAVVDQYYPGGFGIITFWYNEERTDGTRFWLSEGGRKEEIYPTTPVTKVSLERSGLGWKVKVANPPSPLMWLETSFALTPNGQGPWMSQAIMETSTNGPMSWVSERVSYDRYGRFFRARTLRPEELTFKTWDGWDGENLFKFQTGCVPGAKYLLFQAPRYGAAWNKVDITYASPNGLCVWAVGRGVSTRFFSVVKE